MACKFTTLPSQPIENTSSDDESLASAIAESHIQRAVAQENTNCDWDDEDSCSKPYPSSSCAGKAGGVEEGNCNGSPSGAIPFFRKTHHCKDRLQEPVRPRVPVPVRRCRSVGHLLIEERSTGSLDSCALHTILPHFRSVWHVCGGGGAGVKVDASDSTSSPSTTQHCSSASCVPSDGNFRLDPVFQLNIEQTRSASTVDGGEAAAEVAGVEEGLDVESICSNMETMDELLIRLLEGLQAHQESPKPQSLPPECRDPALRPSPPQQPPDSLHPQASLQPPDSLHPPASMHDVALAVRRSWHQHRRLMEGLVAELQSKEETTARLLNRQAMQAAANARLRQERQDLQTFLKEKECDWLAIEKTLKMEAEILRTRLLELVRSTKEGESPCSLLQGLMQTHLDREQCIALDTAKQNKINQLRLLIFRQQAVIRDLEEHNSELVTLLRDKNADKEGVGESGDHSESSQQPRTSLSDVLHCDRGFFLPHRSRHPQLAALQVYAIGGQQGELQSCCEEEFDPTRLFLGRPPSPCPDSPDLARALLEELQRHGPASPHFRLED